MKTIDVVAAIICDSLARKTKILAVARGHGEFKGLWEFPGGKIEKEEEAKEALKREIREELDININIGPFLKLVEYTYPKFHLSMRCYWAEISSGSLTLKEHIDARWLSKDELNSLDWLPADIDVLDDIAKGMVL